MIIANSLRMILCENYSPMWNVSKNLLKNCFILRKFGHKYWNFKGIVLHAQSHILTYKIKVNKSTINKAYKQNQKIKQQYTITTYQLFYKQISFTIINIVSDHRYLSHKQKWNTRKTPSRVFIFLIPTCSHGASAKINFAWNRL